MNKNFSWLTDMNLGPNKKLEKTTSNFHDNVYNLVILDLINFDIINLQLINQLSAPNKNNICSKNYI